MTSSFDALTCPRCGSKRVSAHVEPVQAECEADVWAPTRDEGFRCADCELLEHCLTNEDRSSSAGAAYAAFNRRWNRIFEPFSFEESQAYLKQRDRDDEERARAWTWPTEEPDVYDRSWRAVRMEERRQKETFPHYTMSDGTLQYKGVPAVPRNADLLAQVIAAPDDVAPRWALVAWLRTLRHELAPRAADFIEGQLRLAAGFAKNPRDDLKATLPAAAFMQQNATNIAPGIDWWREPALGGDALYDFTRVLLELGLIDDPQHFRGFVEHVAIKASRFLEIADELYSLAPIRQLTITYCKGPKHDDQGLLRALLESPHLDRIRAVKLPVRKFGWDKGDATELNRLTDADVAAIASSDHLAKLRVLDLEDQRELTVRAFDALAASTKLPELSAVRYDLNHYWYPGTFSFGRSGGQVRELHSRPLKALVHELEARHGQIPWLHVAENYGTDAPDIEAVIEHPVGKIAT